MSENQKLLDEFADYCAANPTMRFWQALRNWSGQSFIYVLPVGSQFDGSIDSELLDTFYWRDKDH